MTNVLYGDISFDRIYCETSDLAEERILCFLAYYYQCKYDEGEVRDVSFVRGNLNKVMNWEEMKDKNFDQINVKVETSGMEVSDAPNFVDFANQDIHIGCIIPSLTQEEVLFSCAPEAFISMLINDRLRDRDVVVIKNVRRYCEYTGYLYSFRFTGFYKYSIFNILVIDACYMQHFKRKNIDRDMNKAYLGFLLCNSKISTGHWGCGAFGGEKVSKFLQQLCAAVVANVDLDYSTFKDEDYKAKFNTILNTLKTNNINVSRVYEILLGFQNMHYEEFYDYFMKAINE